jgi:hypothetical protein
LKIISKTENIEFSKKLPSASAVDHARDRNAVEQKRPQSGYAKTKTQRTGSSK